MYFTEANDSALELHVDDGQGPGSPEVIGRWLQHLDSTSS